MKIRCLGTSSGIPVAERHFTSILLECQDRAILLDAGDGTIRQLIRWYDDSSYVETIIISHTHADHAAGLFSILQWMHLSKRREKLTLCLPHPFFKDISTLFDAFWIDQKKWSFPFNIIELKEGQEIQNGPVFFIPVSNSHLDSKYLSMT